MSDTQRQDQLFGEIAIEKQVLSQEKLERALVIQRCITNRTKVYMPIGTVLQKMGVLTEQQVESVLEIQNLGEAAQIQTEPPPDQELPDASAKEHELKDWMDESKQGSEGPGTLQLDIASDKLTATVAPIDEKQSSPGIDAIKLMFMENNISYGLVSDSLLEAYLRQNPLPLEPFIVARGNPPEPGNPPEIQYFFDTDPIRIGTLLEDGSMDWKNRGDIPQVEAGVLLAEKQGGDPGKPGTDIFGQEVPPPRIKDPPLKFSKGASRSEDGRQIFAKINGTPRLGIDGRVGVSAVLPIDTDIGVETGNVIFEGHIEVDGGIDSGYIVKGASLTTREVQNASIEMRDDIVVYGGIYGSTVKAGGHVKASHVHNCTMEVLGDLVVEKEIFGCTLEINGRCVIEGGKIIGSKVIAKKGIQAKDIGTPAAKPSELTVGVDFKYERDMKACDDTLADCERKKTEAQDKITALKKKNDELDADLGEAAQEQDACMVQKRQLQEKLKSPAVAGNKEKENMLEELIGDLGKKYDLLDKKVQSIMATDDQVRAQIAHYNQVLQEMEKLMEETRQQIGILEESAKLDPGIPVIKAGGMVFSKTLVIGPHKKMIIPKEMQGVRIAESLADGKQYQIKISPLK